MKIDEYAPDVSPMTRASPKYCSVVAPRIWAPMTRTANTGKMATNEVLIDRARVWFIDRLTTSS